MLIIDQAGQAGPVIGSFTAPQAGKTLPLNQRYSRMWRIPEQTLERLSLESSLHHGFERGEFVIYYQPLGSIATGRIDGVEALLRWSHPDQGLLLPEQFVAAAEVSGLIVPLGEWVLRTACAQAKTWLDAGLPPLRIAVNISGVQFQQAALVATVVSTLAETGLNPDCLELEITESAVTENTETVSAMLNELRDAGVRTAIDDFGTGYSSFGYLRDFPTHALKIDRSFVQGVPGERTHATIAAAIIALAHNLDLEVVAEGIETWEQLAFFREQQCDRFQGFLLGEPLPPESIGKVLEAADDEEPTGGEP